MNVVGAMQHLRSRDYRRVPWRNGGGVTAEIAVAPDAGAFDWRVSMAEVAADGPFSVFPGVDRVLTVIDGEGLTLEIEGRTAAPGQAPFAFPGDVPCFARLAAGPVTDLNVMTRRGRCRAVVGRAPAAALPGVIERLVFAADGPLAGRVGGAGFALAARDTLRLRGREAARLDLAGAWLDIQIIPGDAS
jgi:environmental stress-induced protein Ves